jgi:hypothetical protein
VAAVGSSRLLYVAATRKGIKKFTDYETFARAKGRSGPKIAGLARGGGRGVGQKTQNRCTAADAVAPETRSVVLQTGRTAPRKLFGAEKFWSTPLRTVAALRCYADGQNLRYGLFHHRYFRHQIVD